MNDVGCRYGVEHQWCTDGTEQRKRKNIFAQCSLSDTLSSIHSFHPATMDEHISLTTIMQQLCAFAQDVEPFVGPNNKRLVISAYLCGRNDMEIISLGRFFIASIDDEEVVDSFMSLVIELHNQQSCSSISDEVVHTHQFDDIFISKQSLQSCIVTYNEMVNKYCIQYCTNNNRRAAIMAFLCGKLRVSVPDLAQIIHPDTANIPQAEQVCNAQDWILSVA